MARTEINEVKQVKQVKQVKHSEGLEPVTAYEPEPRQTLRAQLPHAFAALRPRQWTKNGLVLLALVFARRLTDGAAVERVLLAFAAFALASSAVYIFNDLVDRDRDRLHPRKRLRPLASGALSPRIALATAVLALLVSAALTTWLVMLLARATGDPFALWGGSPLLLAGGLVAYVGMNIAYSLALKRLALWDVFIIALGFVLRAFVGALAVPAPISPWFYLCAIFLALFLALGKRRAELLTLNGDAASHRENLGAYNQALLDQLVTITVTCALISYSLYTFQGENANHDLMLTVPFALFGVFRYLYLMYTHNIGDRPDEVLWRDRQILICVALWALAILALLYGLPHQTL
ncbi:MAG: decaprenyl-phosphate phosphoribosyltransferase [Ktedonobacterales bacterium]